VADLDGDGEAEVLAAVNYAERDLDGELLCLSSRGALRWRVSFPEDVLRFRGGTYHGPWRSDAVAVFQRGDETRIAWARDHHIWWPSSIDILDASGRRLSRFVHAGAVYTMRATDGPTGPLLVAGGVSNANAAAMMLVLDATKVTGASPEARGSPFDCLDCPPGRPQRYFVFAPSCVTLGSGSPYNQAAALLASDRAVEVSITEAPNRAGSWLPFNTEHRFSPDFRLEHSAQGDSFGPVHRHFEAEGRIRHRLEDCPDWKRPPRVRMWTPEGGWTDVGPPTGP
jgi:hypothetical protein